MTTAQRLSFIFSFLVLVLLIVSVPTRDGRHNWIWNGPVSVDHWRFVTNCFYWIADSRLLYLIASPKTR